MVEKINPNLSDQVCGPNKSVINFPKSFVLFHICVYNVRGIDTGFGRVDIEMGDTT